MTAERQHDPTEASREDDFLFYLHRGSELLKEKRPEEARTALERAFQISPDSPKAQNLLGLVYFKLGLLEAAKSIYDRLVEEYPNEPPLYVNLGLVLLRQGRLNEAERALKKAIAIAPDHARAHCYLGLVLYRRGDLALAREHFLKGQADEFAKKVEARLAQGTSMRPSQADMLRAVAENGFKDLEANANPFRSLDVAKDERVVRDEEAWETWVPHERETKEPATQLSLDVTSLLPVWNLTPLPLPADDPLLPRMSGADPLRDTSPGVVSPWQEPTPQIGTLARMNPSLSGNARAVAAAVSRLPTPLFVAGPSAPPPANGRPADTWSSDQEALQAARESLAFPALSLPAQAADELAVLAESADLPDAVMFGEAGTPTGDLLSEVERVADREKTSSSAGYHAGPGSRARLVMDARAYLKSSTIVAASGRLQMTPAMSQLQGHETATPFGDPSDPMCLLEGKAVVLIRVPRMAVALRGVRDLHVVTSSLMGFDDGFTWDNGKILGLDVVTLRGSGTLLLDTRGSPMLIPVDAETPVHAAVDAILAWSDGVRPSPVEGANSEVRLFRLRGRGYVLVAFPPDSSIGPSERR